MTRGEFLVFAGAALDHAVKANSGTVSLVVSLRREARPNLSTACAAEPHAIVSAALGLLQRVQEEDDGFDEPYAFVASVMVPVLKATAEEWDRQQAEAN